MGVPDRPSQGKHGSAGRAGGQGQPRDGVPPIKRYIPAFWNSLAPASLPKVDEEKEEDAEKLGKSSSEKYSFRSGPPPSPMPSPRSSICRRLSFEMNPSRNRNLPRRRRRPEAFLPFLKSRRPAVSWSSSSV